MHGPINVKYTAPILHNYALRTLVYLMTSCSIFLIKTLLLFLRRRSVTTLKKTLDLFPSTSQPANKSYVAPVEYPISSTLISKVSYGFPGRSSFAIHTTILWAKQRSGLNTCHILRSSLASPTRQHSVNGLNHQVLTCEFLTVFTRETIVSNDR